ncbi:MAG: glycosyltransferase [Candidatus Omnitrophica bacterium]|nr:glycosyltransferase [Candidatus Omnitrophota bacterium]
MKILVCYASSGTGHRKSAEAVHSYLTRHHPQHSAELIDILAFTNPVFKRIYDRGYLYLITRLRPVWALLYHLSHFCASISSPFRFLVNRLNTSGFARYVFRSRPDVIISTHFLINEILDFLIKYRGLRARLFCVITDFDVHRYWLFDSVYKFVVALDSTRDALMALGIDRSRIMVTGIPVAEEYHRIYDKALMRMKLGLRKDGFTVLIAGGTVGMGPLERIVERLRGNVDLMVVCGHNRKIFRKLNESNLRGVKVFGFVDNMYELMAAADAIVTKPGGLSVSESIAMGLPMIFISPIPGQEVSNVRVLARYGVGALADSAEAVKEAVLDLKNDPDNARSAAARVRQLSNPAVLSQIYDEICKSCPGDPS